MPFQYFLKITALKNNKSVFILNHLKIIIPKIIVLCIVSIWLGNATPSHGAELSFIAKDDGNKTGRVALVIDKAEKIAGLKLTVTYDNELLSFIAAEKSTATSSFLHVVNDKNPGKVIIVMASAKGVSGDKVTLLHMSFSQKGKASESTPEISVTQLQLMNENLKEIKGNRPKFLFKRK